MTITIHLLTGCAPEPLSHYLKALGVFRLLAEGPDHGARAFWRNDGFLLASTLDRPALLRFFLEGYAPTPLLAPWNGGSGFYPKDSKDGIEALAASPAARFGAYREAILRARAIVGDRQESPKKDEKNLLLQECRRSWTGTNLDWLNAAVVLTGEDGAQYPALLGTGGNDGRLDFTNNQMQRLSELFETATGVARAGAAELLSAALFGEPIPGLDRCAIGQYFPGAAGGANQAAGYSGEALVNPWDFVLMLEGAVMLQVAAVRRLDGGGLPQAAAPFAVRGQAGGYTSATETDEDNRRGEQWMPLWEGAASLSEVKALFAEGRMQSGRQQAHKALDAARAVARVGVARGIRAFVRFGYLERNGQANLAVPLGRWPVRDDPQVRLLDQIDPWVESLRRASQAAGAPESLGRAVRRIEAAMFATCRGSSPERWQRLLVALAETEDLLASRPKATAEARLQPIPPLDFGWFAAADDERAEVSIALAVASQTGLGEPDPIRAHCLPLDPKSHFQRFASGGDSLRRDPRVVWIGRDLVDDLGQVALRRIIESARSGSHAFPLQGRVFAPLDAVSRLLDGTLDEQRTASLARAFMALEWGKREATPALPRGPRTLQAAHALFRLVYAPGAVDTLSPRRDPAPLRLLLAGRLQDASRAALDRLGASGVRPKIRSLGGSADLARRLAATVAIPIAPGDLRALLELLRKPETHADGPTRSETPVPAPQE